MVGVHHRLPLLHHQARIQLWHHGARHRQPAVRHYAREYVYFDRLHRRRHLQRVESIRRIIIAHWRGAILEGISCLFYK